MKLKMRFLAPPISLACLLLGLCFADAAQAQIVLRAPQKIELPAITTQGSLELVAYTDFADSCEDYGPYQVQINGSSIVVNSYVVSASQEECAPEVLLNKPKTYEVKPLMRDHSYEVFFRSLDGQLVYAGRLQASH